MSGFRCLYAMVIARLAVARVISNRIWRFLQLNQYDVHWLCAALVVIADKAKAAVDYDVDDRISELETHDYISCPVCRHLTDSAVK
jgi:hypothetical protein